VVDKAGWDSGGGMGYCYVSGVLDPGCLVLQKTLEKQGKLLLLLVELW